MQLAVLQQDTLLQTHWYYSCESHKNTRWTCSLKAQRREIKEKNIIIIIIIIIVVVVVVVILHKKVH